MMKDMYVHVEVEIHEDIVVQDEGISGNEINHQRCPLEGDVVHAEGGLYTGEGQGDNGLESG